MYVKANRMKPYAASLATTNSCKTQSKGPLVNLSAGLQFSLL